MLEGPLRSASSAAGEKEPCQGTPGACARPGLEPQLGLGPGSDCATHMPQPTLYTALPGRGRFPRTGGGSSAPTCKYEGPCLERGSSLTSIPSLDALVWVGMAVGAGCGDLGYPDIMLVLRWSLGSGQRPAVMAVDPAALPPPKYPHCFCLLEFHLWSGWEWNSRATQSGSSRI